MLPSRPLPLPQLPLLPRLPILLPLRHQDTKPLIPLSLPVPPTRLLLINQHIRKPLVPFKAHIQLRESHVFGRKQRGILGEFSYYVFAEDGSETAGSEIFLRVGIRDI